MRISSSKCALVGVLALAIAGCSYRYYAGDLKPLSETEQGESQTVLDDGTVVFAKDRLEIRVRPMTDEELNRQYAANTRAGTNPYTNGNTKVFRTNETPTRFTVLRVAVKNYEYPKVHLDPNTVYITTENGRKYHALTFDQLWTYYRSYALGGAGGQTEGSSDRSGSRYGNEYNEWGARTDLLKRTMFRGDAVFSGQEQDGYVVFRPLDADVSQITVHLPDIAIRFDYRDEPLETIDISARFQRETGKVYPDGRKTPM